MPLMSGKVAVLSTDLQSVLEVRDLGERSIQVKANVLPYVEVKPSLNEGERLTGPTLNIIEGKRVDAEFGKEAIPDPPPDPIEVLTEQITSLEARVVLIEG